MITIKQELHSYAKATNKGKKIQEEEEEEIVLITTIQLQ
jgi:hypothetical protein